MAECVLSTEDLFKCYYGTCKPDDDTLEPTEYPTYLPTEDPVDDNKKCDDKCTKEYDPVCCKIDGKEDQFDNRCLAECSIKWDDLFKCYYGICKEDDDTEEPSTPPTPQPTPKPTRSPTKGGCKDECRDADYDPVCCQLNKGDIEFDNRCLAECELSLEDMFKCYYGKCPDKDRTDQPSYDPTEYPSFFPSEIPTENPTDDDTKPPKPTPKPTKSPSVMVPTPESTEDCDEKCESAEYKPVCCDGTTFDNRCLAECELHLDELLRCYYGKCPDKTDMPTYDPTFYPSGMPTPEPTEFPTIDDSSDSFDGQFLSAGLCCLLVG